MDLKITINLRKEEASAGSLNLTMGNLQVLLLHRVLRLVQMYFSPLDLKKVFARSLRVLHWIFGPSLKVLQSKEKHIGVKIKMDGPTLILPEQKENQDLFSIYLGQVSLENMMMKEGAVENLMLVVAGGQVTRAVMNMNQCIEQVDLIVDELGCKMDLKRNRGKGTTDVIVSVDNTTVALGPKDIQLGLHILQNNLLKTKQDLCDLFPDCPFPLSEEQLPLVIGDSNWTTEIMVDQVSLDSTKIIKRKSPPPKRNFLEKVLNTGEWVVKVPNYLS